MLSRRSLSSTRILLCVLLGISLLGVSPAFAGEKDSPARKLGRGMANMSLGVMAIPSEMIKTTKRSGPTVGVTWGFVRGAGLMVALEAVGLWEVLTCPFATPPDYEAILQPEFPWQRFTDDPTETRPGGERRVRTATAGGRRGPR